MHIWRALFFAIIHWGNTQEQLSDTLKRKNIIPRKCGTDPGNQFVELLLSSDLPTPYNSIQDTCCEGNLTKGLSELVSLCCSSVAYNPLNEICCGSHVYPRTAHTECCRNGEWTRLDNSTNSSSKNTEIFLLVSGTQALPQIAIWNSSFNLIVKSLMMHKSLESSMNVIVFSYSVWTDVCLCF
ncbi:hypothetical protein Z043-121988 [Arapaima gigas]